MPPSRPSRTQNVTLSLYSAALALALGITMPWWVRGLRRGGKYREGVSERFGRVPARLARPSGRQPVIWLHVVSVGEALAAVPLVRQLRGHAEVYVSTTTRTGQALARERFGADHVFYFPLDWAFAVRSWLRFLRPRLLVLVESEFWPRLLHECARAGVRVAVVNARVSARSWPRYRRLRFLWRPLLSGIALALTQSGEDAARLRALGVPRVEFGGNLKYDLAPPTPKPLITALRAHLPKHTPVLVCGSTLAGEEALLLAELPPEPVLVLAPRHPERFAEAAALLAAQARPWVRLSAWPRTPIVPGSILLLDSIGELAALYELATIALVGGGWLHPGGHNPLEPAALGRPVVVGPGFTNFREVVRTLSGEDAIVIAGRETLHAAVSTLLAASEQAAAMGARAAAVCARNTGATARAAAAIRGLLEQA